MKLFTRSLVFVLLVHACCAAQDGAEKKLEGFAWLKQFEGNWIAKQEMPKGDGQLSNSTMSSQTIGGNWITNTYRGDFGGMKFTGVQTLGYDKKKKAFVGSWVDSMMSHRWEYVGKLDESGKKILLEAEGPDMSDPTKMVPYRDVYEFKSSDEITAMSQMKNEKGEWQSFMRSTMTRAPDAKTASTAKVTPFLMFIGKAEEAIEFYKTVFDEVSIDNMTKYGAGEPGGKEGTVKIADITIEGQNVRCIDSLDVHDFTFTPSFSFFVECDSEEQLMQRFEKISDGGKVMMPPNNYGFSKKFAWTSDKFGVSWQLNLK